jgi:hypothetical protein
MLKLSCGLLLIALTTLMMELTLIRVFDVLWYTNMAYMVITLAMFCFGLSGVYAALRPLKKDTDVRFYISVLAFLFALFTFAIRPIMNFLPFDFNLIYTSPWRGLLYFQFMYLALAIPFFLSGLIFTTVFSRYAGKIQSLYFWDLAGAAIGCIVLVPLLPRIGPGGIMFVATAFGLWASGLFSENRKWSFVALIVGFAILITPFVHTGGYFEFSEHIYKRGVKRDRDLGRVEMSYWDPISKIDVINQGRWKHIAYDGGSQSTFIFPFDGNFKALREAMPKHTMAHFGGQNVYISNYIKRDSDQKVLIIGSAGGQETKSALMYGAAHIDAVEMVDFVVRIGKTSYADYNGNIFNHPNVHTHVGEGRSFLRASKEKYDIIQIYSNHTTSAIAAGTGAMATTYLQTAEAYQEYFSHLTKNGILHINHHIYPRMVTTAALAWKKMGRENFKQHVAVFEAVGPIQDNLPTMLIKMQPWTKSEVDAIRNFFWGHTKLKEDPLDDKKSFLSPVFYSGSLPSELVKRIKFRVQACTDDKPYFNFLRKTNEMLPADPPNFMNYSTAALLDSQLQRGSIPTDVIHLIVTGAASLLFTGLFILIPLFFSKAGKTKWPRKGSTLVYFACLGAGFILIELVFIQLFMKLIGYPLYTYSTVVFALLLSAAVGSAASGKMNISVNERWAWPFVSILIMGVILIFSHTAIFDFFLTSATPVRILTAVMMIFPIGFFMGMPFPLGILAIKKQPAGAIAWAWGLNGLFTVIGGLLSVILSIFIGFKATIWIALAIYCLALAMFAKIRNVHV